MSKIAGPNVFCVESETELLAFELPEGGITNVTAAD